MRRVRFGHVLCLLLALALTIPASPAAAEPPSPCGDVQLIWARGSNRQPDDNEFGRVDADLRSRLGAGISLWKLLVVMGLGTAITVSTIKPAVLRGR